MKKIAVVLFAIIVFGTIGCQLATDEEKIVNIRVHGFVRDKLTNSPLQGCGVYINNGYIDEANEYVGETDITGYYEFRREVWVNYETIIDVTGPDITYRGSSAVINNKNDNERNFFLEKY